MKHWNFMKIRKVNSIKMLTNNFLEKSNKKNIFSLFFLNYWNKLIYKRFLIQNLEILQTKIDENCICIVSRDIATDISSWDTQYTKKRIHCVCTYTSCIRVHYCNRLRVVSYILRYNIIIVSPATGTRLVCSCYLTSAVRSVGVHNPLATDKSNNIKVTRTTT